MASLENTHHYLKKYKAFTLTQTCELDIEITVSKNCEPLFSWPPFSSSMGPVDPSVENPGKNTAVGTNSRCSLKGQMNLKIEIFSFVTLPSPNTKKNHPKWDLNHPKWDLGKDLFLPKPL